MRLLLGVYLLDLGASFHRRVERVALSEESNVRRHVSVDVTLVSPPEHLESVLVPLTQLPKGAPLAGFDARDESSAAPPVLTAPQGWVFLVVGTLLVIIASINALHWFVIRQYGRALSSLAGLAIAVGLVVAGRWLIGNRRQPFTSNQGKA